MELQYLCAMYFKTSGRINPATQQYDSYYRLVESYRNADGQVCHRTILNISFLNVEPYHRSGESDFTHTDR